MIETKDGQTTITCDKCRKQQTAPEKGNGEVFYNDGWTCNFNAKIYVHKCFDCLSKKQKKTNLSIKKRFG